ncbi:MAG TPA: hypothetical protein PLY93_07775 [Turneriella sp.]|nr:hypothetical protein [Turneriella sp.]
MRRMLIIMAIAVFSMPYLYAVPFTWESKADEPGFVVDVPASWSKASRARDGVGNVHFEKKEKTGRVAIEVRAYSTEDTDIDQLVLQLRTRLAVKYDRLYLQKRQEMTFRKGVEKQIWNARVGKIKYALTTAFVVADNRVLQITCIAPVSQAKRFTILFDNALLSLDFGDGSAAEPASAEAPAETPAATPVAPESAVNPPAAPSGKPQPPVIQF